LNPCRHMPMSEHSLKSNTTPLIEPSSKSNSTTLPKHKNALPRVTNSKQEQPMDIDPNTIPPNSCSTNRATTRTHTTTETKPAASAPQHLLLNHLSVIVTGGKLPNALRLCCDFRSTLLYILRNSLKSLLIIIFYFNLKNQSITNRFWSGPVRYE
jgi:hypothetical protein